MKTKQPETIGPGMKGFLVAFRNQESRCISEFYDFINKVWQNKYFNVKSLKALMNKVVQLNRQNEAADEFDFETALRLKLKKLKPKTKRIGYSE